MDEFDSCDGVEFMDGSGDSDNTASMSTAAPSINLGFLDEHEGIVAASDTEMLTTEWVPGSAGVDVSGPEPLGCAAFLDYTAEAPHAHLPSVTQIPWVFIEEPMPRGSHLPSPPFRDASPQTPLPHSTAGRSGFLSPTRTPALLPSQLRSGRLLAPHRCRPGVPRPGTPGRPPARNTSISSLQQTPAN